MLAADVALGPSLAELAESAEPGLMALSPQGADLLKADNPRQCGFIFGIEGPGLPDSWPEARRYSIPMAPEVESLNAAAPLAVALVIWKARRPH
mgnify:FL=1